jgi:hypothetical protein
MNHKKAMAIGSHFTGPTVASILVANEVDFNIIEKNLTVLRHCAGVQEKIFFASLDYQARGMAIASNNIANKNLYFAVKLSH